MGLSGNAITSGIVWLQPIKDNSFKDGKMWALFNSCNILACNCCS